MTDIRARGLTVEFGGNRIVDELDLDVADGEWVGVIGPNGAGKTTLLRALSGATYSRGNVSLGGRGVRDLDRRSLARLIAYVPQLPLIPRAMSVTDYVLLGRTPYIPYLGVETTEDLHITEEVLARLELLELAHRALGSLSGGELQRTVLARALAQRAPVLILDEPTSSLDVGHQQQVLELVDSLRKERRLTVVSAMHDLTLAGLFCDRLILLRDGQIVAQGDPSAVLTEDEITANYGASVKVVRDNGTLLVIPTRSGR